MLDIRGFWDHPPMLQKNHGHNGPFGLRENPKQPYGLKGDLPYNHQRVMKKTRILSGRSHPPKWQVT